MISDDDIERCVDYLRDSAIPAAKAKAEVEYLSSYLSVVKAEEMAAALLKGETTISAQDRDARIADRYKETLRAYQTAVEEDSKYRFLREAAETKVRAWQTLKASARSGI